MSEYGEPWSLIGEPGDCWIEDKGGASIVEQSCDCSDAQICRLVQCTNALAGIPNPEAVRELIRVCRELRDADPNEIWKPGAGYILAICYAVEALTAPSASPQQK